MNKQTLVTKVAADTGLGVSTVKAVLNSITGNITTSLSKKEGVSIVGFGSFNIVTRPPRLYHHPRKRVNMNIPERTTMVFKPGVHIKKAVEA